MLGTWIVRFLALLVTLMLFAGLMEYGAGIASGDRLLLIVALSFLGTFVHELGHAAAIGWTGGTVRQFCVFGIAYAPDRRRFSLAGLSGHGDVAGFVRAKPPERGWTRREAALVMAGGPLFDIALGLVALAAVALASAQPGPAPSFAPVVREGAPPVTAPGRLPDEADMERILMRHERDRSAMWVGDAASMLALLAFGSAILNLLPRPGSDGAQLLELWRGRNRFAKKRAPGSGPG